MDILLALFLGLFAVFSIYPMVFIANNAFKPLNEVFFSSPAVRPKSDAQQFPGSVPGPGGFLGADLPLYFQYLFHHGLGNLRDCAHRLPRGFSAGKIPFSGLQIHVRRDRVFPDVQCHGRGPGQLPDHVQAAHGRHLSRRDHPRHRLHLRGVPDAELHGPDPRFHPGSRENRRSGGTEHLRADHHADVQSRRGSR